MTAVVVSVDAVHADRVAAELTAEGIEIVAIVPPEELVWALGERDRGAGSAAVVRAVASCEAIVVSAHRRLLTESVAAVCDTHGVRLVGLADDRDDVRHVRALGLPEPLPSSAPGWRIADAATAAAPPVTRTRDDTSTVPAIDASPSSPPRVIVVWGPAGAPGRTTISVELAVELARSGRHVALIDADSQSPSIALALGLADEGPGFAAACRAADRGELDAAELTRISTPLPVAGGTLDVLTGINRPGRWPELSADRVATALEMCREWAADVVVDVAAPLERDEEIMSDLDGPHRNAATLSALRTADLVVAVAAADPLGMSRFVRGYPELRSVIGATPVRVIVNRLRTGALGIDARGQVRRTLDRFVGIEDLDFLPADPRAADAASLSARPIADAAARSPIVHGVRRFVRQRIVTPGPPEARRGLLRRDRKRTA